MRPTLSSEQTVRMGRHQIGRDLDDTIRNEKRSFCTRKVQIRRRIAAREDLKEFCATLFWAARNLLILKWRDGEWLSSFAVTPLRRDISP